jgi:hypothetical protein
MWLHELLFQPYDDLRCDGAAHFAAVMSELNATLESNGK